MGRTVRLLVTGGASGLGRAIALGAAQRGAKVAVADIDKAGGEAVAKACGGHALAVDLIEDAEQAVEDGAKLLGGLDVLVNNAGFGAGEAFLEMRAETWDRTLGLNVKALALATAAAGRIMMKKKAGRIINITSPASRMALPNYTAYAASKAAVDAITRAAAVALAPHGIRVNSVAPGMMDTPMQRVTEEQLARIEGRNDIGQVPRRTHRAHSGRQADRAGGSRQDRAVACVRRAGLHHGRAAERVGRAGQGLMAMTNDTRACRITKVTTYVVGARWRNFVFAHVETDEGISGIGEGSLEYQPKAVEAAIQQLTARYAIGRSAFATEKLWHDILRNEFMHSPIINSAAAALEMAMLDIAGKALGRPVYDLLGGKVHEILPAYANAWYGVGQDARRRSVRRRGGGRERLSRPEVRSVRGCGPRSRQGVDPEQYVVQRSTRQKNPLRIA